MRRGETRKKRRTDKKLHRQQAKEEAEGVSELDKRKNWRQQINRRVRNKRDKQKAKGTNEAD
jgi:hypothetical protein